MSQKSAVALGYEAVRRSMEGTVIYVESEE